jgi:hypothetical protein
MRRASNSLEKNLALSIGPLRMGTAMRSNSAEVRVRRTFQARFAFQVPVRLITRRGRLYWITAEESGAAIRSPAGQMSDSALWLATCRKVRSCAHKRHTPAL